MIFGKTVEQKEREEQDEIKGKIFGKRKFALFPQLLMDGRSVWLGYYWEYVPGTHDGFKYKIYRDEEKRYLKDSFSHVEVNIGYTARDHINMAKVEKHFNDWRNEK